MTLREQFTQQRDRARAYASFQGISTELWLVRYGTGHVDARIAIIGHAISPAAIDVWRSCGARCKRIGWVVP